MQDEINKILDNLATATFQKKCAIPYDNHSKAKHHVHKVGIGEVKKNSETGRGRTQVVGKSIQGGVTCGTTV